MNRIAKFEKVSLEQFTDGWTDTFQGASKDDAEKIYNEIQLPRRATAGSAGYDSHWDSRVDGAGVGVKVLSEEWAWF